jgi:hypothetical protein
MNSDDEIYARVAPGHKIQDATSNSPVKELDIAIDTPFGELPGIPSPSTDTFRNISDKWLCGWTDDDFTIVPLEHGVFRGQVSGAVSLDVTPMSVSTDPDLSHAEVDTVSIATADQIPVDEITALDADNVESAIYSFDQDISDLKDRFQVNTIDDGNGELFEQRYVRIRDTSSRELQPREDGELYMQCQDIELPPEWPDTSYSGIPVDLSDDTTEAVWRLSDEPLDNYVMTATEIVVVSESDVPDELDF